MDVKMPGFFYETLKSRLDEVGLSLNRAAFLSEITRSRFPEWRKGNRLPSDTEIERLSSVRELGLTSDQLRAWRTIEEYGMDAVEAFYEELRRVDPERFKSCTS